MNERIKELAVQATTYIEPTENSGEGWIFDKEKFAELIVRECEKILIENVEVALDASGNPVSPEDFIKEHFGVEE